LIKGGVFLGLRREKISQKKKKESKERQIGGKEAKQRKESIKPEAEDVCSSAINSLTKRCARIEKVETAAALPERNINVSIKSRPYQPWTSALKKNGANDGLSREKSLATKNVTTLQDGKRKG